VWKRLEQASGRFLNEVQHPFETRGSTVVRIRHLPFARFTKLEEQAQLWVVLWGRFLAQSLEVVLVHCDDEVKPIEILDRHASSPNTLERYAATFSCSARPAIGWLTRVVGMGTGRLDVQACPTPCQFRVMAKHAFRRRRAANVAHAHEKYTYG
jgi:hypothetical protein